VDPLSIEECGFRWVQDDGTSDFEYKIRLRPIAGGDFVWNEEPQYEKLLELATLDLQKKIREEFGLECVMLPLVKDRGTCPFTFPIFHSKDIATNDKIIVIVLGTGRVRLGQWSRKVCMNNTLAEGSVLPFLHEAIRVRGCAVLLTNPNVNSYMTESGRILPIPGHHSAEEHLKSLYWLFLAHSKATEIAIIAHSYGGVSTVDLFSDEAIEADLIGKNRLKCIAMTDSVHGKGIQLTGRTREWFLNNAINFIRSREPPGKDCGVYANTQRASAGTENHALTSYSCRELLWRWIDCRMSFLPASTSSEVLGEKSLYSNLVLSLSSPSSSDLEKLPHDLLNLVCDWLPTGMDLYQLHRSSKTMLSRLVLGKTVKHLQWVNHPRIIAFPSFSDRFRHLEFFSMVIPPNCELERRMTPKALLSLPPSLTALCLNFRGAHSICFKHYAPIFKNGGFSTNITGSQQDFEQALDLASAFPVLKKASLIGEFSPISMRLISIFSASVTSFTCYGSDSPISSALTVPANIVELQLPARQNCTLSELKTAPNLQNLVLNALTRGSVDWIPPELHTLKLSAERLPWTPVALSALAQHATLTTLQCNSLDALKYLPPGLTDLFLYSMMPVDVEHLKALPRRLRSFMGYTLIGDLSDWSFWPPELQRLRFYLLPADLVDASDPRWLQLPRTLTALDVLSSHQHVAIDPSYLPPLIKNTSLRLKVRESSRSFDFSHLSKLSYLTVDLIADPATLNSLNVDASPSTSEQTSSIDQTSSCSQLVLPCHLQLLRWSSHVYGFTEPTPEVALFRDHFALPSSLTSLDIDNVKFLSKSFVHNLPRLLTSLTLDLKDKSIPVAFGSAELKSLPPWLVTLCTPLSPDSDDSFVPFLPRGLTTLKLERIRTFSDSMVKHLPRGLFSLQMRHAAYGLTDECLGDLPETLTSLMLEHNKSFTPQAFFSVPRCRLTNVDLRSNPNFTKKSILESSPPYLYIKGKKFVKF
jgi:hypothetical protein